MQIEKNEPTQSVETELDSQQVSDTSSPVRTKFHPVLLTSIGVVGLLVLLFVFIYRVPVTNPVTRTLVSVLPFPAASINGSWISMEDYANEHDAFFQYLASTETVDIPANDVVRETILDALVNKAAIRAIADQANIKLDTDRVEEFYQEVVSSEGTEEIFEQELFDTFGWTPDQFKKRIIESIVLAMQASEYVQANPELQAESLALIQEELTTPGTIEKTDLGEVAESELPEEWSEVKALEVNGRTGILDFENEYVIFTLSDRLQNAQGVQLQLTAAVSSKKTLEDEVAQYLSDATIRYFVR